MDKVNNLPAVMGAVKTRERVLEEIRCNPGTYSKFKKLDEEFQEKLIEFCMGARGVKMTYDSFLSIFLMWKSILRGLGISFRQY